LTYSAEARGLDVSKSGMAIECSREIAPGLSVHLEARDSSVMGSCVVKHCTRRGLRYQIGLEFSEDLRSRISMNGGAKVETEADYYDVLQISPKADLETIHRVFRIMAARFHPDNPETGDVEEFLRMRRAYAVLSDPDRRAEYDLLRQSRETGPIPIFELKDFVTGVEAESNRRLGVLSLLYNQRRTAPDHPGVSVLDLEQRMAFPREYLNFTMWYLRSKEYVTLMDNSDYALTATGVDFVEKKAARNDILGKLLKPGAPRAKQPRAPGARQEKPAANKHPFLLGTAQKE
jgi:curved DNA-binding protein CbpA